jgi:trk system potassium uptake protein TrkH
MFLAGVNFALHYRMLTGRAVTVFRDTELRVYASIIGIATVLLAIGIWAPVDRLFPVDVELTRDIVRYESLPEALRLAAFQAVSIVTTTGFATADYEAWSPLAVGVLFVLFYIGGMAGSTGGGVKVIRHVLMFKNSYKELRQLVHPQAVLTVRLGDQVVPQDVMRNVLSFIVLYLGLIGFGTLGLAAGGVDLLSSFGGTISAVGNIGPAFGTLGPAENYAHLPAMAKWILSFLMVAGRLEIFTVLIVFASAFWRR